MIIYIPSPKGELLNENVQSYSERFTLSSDMDCR